MWCIAIRRMTARFPVTQGGGAMSSNGIVVDVHQHTGVLKGGDTTGGPV